MGSELVKLGLHGHLKAEMASSFGLSQMSLYYMNMDITRRIRGKRVPVLQNRCPSGWHFFDHLIVHKRRSGFPNLSP
jgi:hypothetical protein